MRAAVRRWHRVAIGVEEAVLAGDPGDGPFHRAMAFALVAFAGEEFLGDGLLAFDAAGEKVLETAWEVEHGALRRVLVAGEQRRGAGPADLHAAEEIGLGARHAEQPRRREGHALAEDLGVRLEADLSAAAVVHRAKGLQRTVGSPSRVGLAIELLPARHLHFEVSPTARSPPRRRRRATAARVIDLRVELAARVQRGHDDFERRLLLELRDAGRPGCRGRCR